MDNSKIKNERHYKLKDPLISEKSYDNSDVKILDYEEILTRIGSLGYFQLIGIFMSIVSFMAEGFLIYAFPFLTLMPDYICVNGDQQIQC